MACRYMPKLNRFFYLRGEAHRDTCHKIEPDYLGATTRQSETEDWSFDLKTRNRLFSQASDVTQRS